MTTLPDLSNAGELDLLCELARRTIARQHGATDPVVSLLRLAGAMTAMLNARQRCKVIDEMRMLADQLEVRELVS